MRIPAALLPDHERYEGVRPVNVWLLRILFLLMFVFVGSDSWTGLLRDQGAWLSSGLSCRSSRCPGDTPSGADIVDRGL
jgi:hypothetical protein